MFKKLNVDGRDLIKLGLWCFEGGDGEMYPVMGQKKLDELYLDKEKEKKEREEKNNNSNISPTRNPNKRPTTINMNRSIGRMEANDRDVIRQAKIEEEEEEGGVREDMTTMEKEEDNVNNTKVVVGQACHIIDRRFKESRQGVVVAIYNELIKVKTRTKETYQIKHDQVGELLIPLHEYDDPSQPIIVEKNWYGKLGLGEWGYKWV